MKTFYTILRCDQEDIPADVFQCMEDAKRAAETCARNEPNDMFFVVKAVSVSKAGNAVTTSLSECQGSGLDPAVPAAFVASDRK